jgi:hypothetical protein
VEYIMTEQKTQRHRMKKTPVYVHSRVTDLGQSLHNAALPVIGNQHARKRRTDEIHVQVKRKESVENIKLSGQLPDENPGALYYSRPATSRRKPPMLRVSKPLDSAYTLRIDWPKGSSLAIDVG